MIDRPTDRPTNVLTTEYIVFMTLVQRTVQVQGSRHVQRQGLCVRKSSQHHDWTTRSWQPPKSSCTYDGTLSWMADIYPEVNTIPVGRLDSISSSSFSTSKPASERKLSCLSELCSSLSCCAVGSLVTLAGCCLRCCFSFCLLSHGLVQLQDMHHVNKSIVTRTIRINHMSWSMVSIIFSLYFTFYKFGFASS